MRKRRVAVVLVLAGVAACSTESSDDALNPQPLPPEEEGTRGPNAGAAVGDGCQGTCCAKPAEGSACDVTTDTTCSWAVTCPTGLVLPYEITCTDGAWKLTHGCPAEGELDERGCPARQPDAGAACESPPGRAAAQCGYVLECDGYRKSALAACSGGEWQTTPLGACD